MNADHKYNFSKLQPLEGWAGSITIQCFVTGRRQRWNEAALEGWKADLNGAPFSAYYSPESFAKIEYTI
jgi:hypothetical protein